PVLLTLLPFDTIPIHFLEKLTVSFSSFGILSHMEGGNASRAVIERLQQSRLSGKVVDMESFRASLI
ncbi:MAG: hypothetical protein MR939_07160, partial [Clostridiales bacterium]|nr:hypothetical protein [Clostridiales bacterium]